MEHKIALIGCDTSHSVHFSRILNDQASTDYVGGARIVAAVPDPYGSIAGSAGKALRHAAEIESAYGVALCEDIADLPDELDAVFILGTDGDRHLPQFLECVERRLPIFIDKPIALSSEEAETIFRVAGERNVPVMSASSLRYEDHFRAALNSCDRRQITGADIFGFLSLLDSAPGYFWYGIHLAEILFAIMGTGMEQVKVVHKEEYDVLTGIWADGRLGVIRGARGPHFIYGGTLHMPAGPTSFVMPEDTTLSYARLMKEVVRFVATGISPVDSRETLEILRFVEMAEGLRQSAVAAKSQVLQGGELNGHTW